MGPIRSTRPCKLASLAKPQSVRILSAFARGESLVSSEDEAAVAFPDESFDTAVAMYIMAVVPDPERVMHELERVCAPGGDVILVNHFSQKEGYAVLSSTARAVC